jgi:molybdopterin-guanine dinucleotide biosynthesis protein A
MTGLILAGGRGSRMGGVDKGLIQWRGEALVVQVLQRLRPQVAQVLISANRNAETYRAWARVVADPDPTAFSGPLTGIHAALASMSTDWLAITPCDLPELPPDAFARLASALDGASAAYAVPAGQSHSLVCLLHRSLTEPLDQYLAGGRRRVGQWLAQIAARAVPFADAQGFMNLNAAADLNAARKA